MGYNEPLRRLPALGFIIDFEKQMYFVKQERVDRMKQLAERLWEERERKIPATVVAAFPGAIVSMSLALGGVARMRTRRLYAVLGNRKTRGEWKKKVQLTEEAKGEIRFWIENFDRFHGRHITENRWETVVEMKVNSDAGERGYGGFLRLSKEVGNGKREEIVQRAREQSCEVRVQQRMRGMLAAGIEYRGEFTMKQQGKSSTWREAWGFYQLIKFAAFLLTGCRVRVFLDNICLVFALGGLVPGFDGMDRVYGGSKKADIQEIVERVCDLCVEMHIHIITQWIPREQNERADYLSKLTTHYDFRVRRSTFEWLERLWGRHTIDRFSSAESVMVQSRRYNSRFWQPGQAGCEAVDAFLQHWAGENNWIHAPYKLIGEVVEHMRSCRAVGTVIVPEWRGAAWWPLIAREEQWSRDVVDWRFLGNAVSWGRARMEVLVPARGAGLDSLPLAKLYALRMDCSRQ